MQAYRHSLFPTLVTETEYPDNEEFLSIFINNCSKYFIDGYTHEGIVSLDLHLDPNFEPLFKFLNQCAINYLNELGVDYKLFSINFTKSWLNILTKELIHRHDHRNYHLSVAYYAQVPDDADHILRLTDINKDRYPFYGISNNLSHKTEFSSMFYDFVPKKGTAIIFPSVLTHEAVARRDFVKERDSRIFKKEDLLNRRICLASDILLTYKENQNQPYGLQPVSNWKTFS
jgi:uncharacterized protein (TIGR02466 family)